MDENERDLNNTINKLDKLNIISVTQKIKESEKYLSEIRKDLNDSIRQAIQMKSVNKSSNDKSFEKCFTIQRKFFNETKKVNKRVFQSINEDEGDIVMLSKKFEMLNTDIDRIGKLTMAIESRLRICEMEVGIGPK